VGGEPFGRVPDQTEAMNSAFITAARVAL